MSSDGLILLRCANCGRGLSGLPDDVLYLCPRCSTVWQLGSEGLRPVALETASAPPRAGTVHLPFWLVDAEVEILRCIYRSPESSTHLQGPREFDPLLPGLREGEPSRSRHSLLIPAFGVDRALSLARRVTGLSVAFSWTQDCPAVLEGGCIDLEDALRVAPGVVLASQVDGPGNLAFASISVSPLYSRVAAIPFIASEAGFSVAGTSLVLPYTEMADARAIADRAGRN